MLRLLLISIALLSPAVAASEGHASAITRCSEREILILLSSLSDLKITESLPIASVSDIVPLARALLESRESSYALLPLCDEAVAMQRRAILMTSDQVGHAALQSTGVLSGANPYTRHYPDLPNAGKELAREMLLTEGHAYLETNNRRLPGCAQPELIELDSLVASFEAAYSRASFSRGDAPWLRAVDIMLAWRAANLPMLPQCLQAIELGYWLSKAAADATAVFALSHAEVPQAQNPFYATLSRARDVLGTWRDQLKLTAAEHEDAIVVALGPVSELPACSREQIEVAYGALRKGAFAMTLDLQSPRGAGDLTNLAETHIKLRKGLLVDAPLCAELFDAVWLARQALGNYVAWASLRALEDLSDSTPLVLPARDTAMQLRSRIIEAKAILESAEHSEEAAPARGDLLACRKGEITFMIAYAFPGFDAYLAAVDARNDEVDALRILRDSLTVTDRLWASMPHCRQALNISVTMQQIVGDQASAIALQLAGVDASDNPYHAEARRAMDRLGELRLELFRPLDSAASAIAAGDDYFVKADPYINIRACAATTCDVVATARYGERLTVTDTTRDWYVIRLDDGQSAFVAGFLLSESPLDA